MWLKCAFLWVILASRRLSHISLMIYCKTHVFHVPFVVNDLCSQIYTPLSTCQHTMAASEGVTKVIASFYRDDLGVVFLTIYVPISYLPTFPGFSP